MATLTDLIRFMQNVKYRQGFYIMVFNTGVSRNRFHRILLTILNSMCIRINIAAFSTLQWQSRSSVLPPLDGRYFLTKCLCTWYRYVFTVIYS